MASASSAKEQLIESIKDVTNILVTVSTDPSVDELSAAIGLTIFLNKLGKHATAVFSGRIPPAIAFLEPDKTFETTADSLREFIIALDKAKADHLRYKIVDDVVKIFITPYRTTITEKDLEFSQGDYNIELVIALNVENGDHLDKALTAHGKILHNATIMTVTSGKTKSNLGVNDWHDSSASSVSEMLVELINLLKTAKASLDEQLATALLTGVVAATDRFSNTATSSKAMTIAAELMAAGANQQLIAIKLAEASQKDAEDDSDPDQPTGEETSPAPPAKAKNSKSKKPAQPDADTTPEDTASLSISHEKVGDVDDVAKQVLAEAQDEAARAAEAHLTKQLAALSTEDSGRSPAIKPLGSSEVASKVEEPLIGGTLNATTELAAKRKRLEEASSQNRTILKHASYIGDTEPSFIESPLNATMAKSDEPPKVDIFATTNAQDLAASSDDATDAAGQTTSGDDAAQDKAEATSKKGPTLAEIEALAKKDKGPVMPMPDFATLPPLPPAPAGVEKDELPVLTDLEKVTAHGDSNFNPSQFQIPGQ